FQSPVRSKMRRQNLKGCFTIVLAIAIEGMGATDVWAVGYYNVPGNVSQYVGYGFGGGYHAPLVLGRITCDGLCARNETRLPYAPEPCSCACFGDPDWMFEGSHSMKALDTARGTPPAADISKATAKDVRSTHVALADTPTMAAPA